MKIKLPISIVIPTKNEEKYLPILLESIKKQSFQPEEIIVADVSTDSTRKIALSYGAHVVNGGIISVGRNNGAKVAKSEYILFLDADSELINDLYLGELYVTAVKNKYDITSSYLTVMTNEPSSTLKSKIYSAAIFGAWNLLFKLGELSHNILIGSGTGMLIKKSVFDALGGFFSDTEIIGEDFELLSRAKKMKYTWGVADLKVATSTRRFRSSRSVLKSAKSSVNALYTLKSNKKSDASKWKDIKRDYGEMGGG